MERKVRDVESTPSQALLGELQVTRFLSSSGVPHYRGGEGEEVSSVPQSSPPAIPEPDRHKSLNKYPLKKKKKLE